MKKIVSLFLTAVVFLAGFSVKGKAEFSTSAQSAILIIPETGTVLYEKNAYKERAMASTTKIMTAILTIEAGDLDEKFEVDEYAICIEGTSMGLRKGDIVTRRALVYGMLLPSGNDAANAAAVSVSGSISAFVELMNKKAEELGLEQTNFVNPSGLDAQGHYTTAYDLAMIAAYCSKNEFFREVCGLCSAELEYGNPPYKRTLYNNNKMLVRYDGACGMKTGFTDNARRCLVSMAERDGVTLIAVTLNAGDDWNDHTKMLDYGFSVTKTVKPSYDLKKIKIDVVGGEDQTLSLKAAKEFSLTVTGNQASKITAKAFVPSFVYAPVKSGDNIGKLVYYFDGKEIETVPLVAKIDIKAQDYNPSWIEELWMFLS